MAALAADHAAVVTGSTLYLKQVKNPADVKLLIQPVKSNSKLGAGRSRVAKGKWKGMPMYQLSLEERKTCPSACEQWSACYGNNMPFANRVNHKHPEFLVALEAEVVLLAMRHPQGFIVRLHVLGDFFSVAYVNWWRAQLRRYPALKVFGYTHRNWAAIGKLNEAGAWIRFSDRGGEMSANVGGEGIPCPQQTGKTESCLTCGICWSTRKAVCFLKH